MKRIASIWLPNLAIERWARSADSPPDAAVVLTIEGAHGPVIHAVTRAAAERGARAGARLTDARALDPALVAVPADPEGDRMLVERLARWAARWSPLVEVDGADALRLDITGVAHLFGSEEALVRDIERCFARIGVTARIAIAPTAAAAWALVRFDTPLSPRGEREGAAKRQKGEGCESSHSPHPPRSARHPLPIWEERLVQALSPLPVSALRLDGDTVRTLERLGLKTIGALMDVPRLALARRFRGAANVVDALDRMLGRKPEPLTAAAVAPPPRALIKLEEPATHPEAAGQALERLIPPLVQQLQKRHLGARRLSLTGYRVDGSIAAASVATAIASREPKHLQRLLAEKTAALDPEFGFDAFALTADWTETLDAGQESLVEEPGGSEELARLVDRLTVKLGTRAVRRPERHESHLPERASGWVGAVCLPSLSREGQGVGGGRAGSMPARKLLQSRRATSAAPTPNPSPEGEGKNRPSRLLDRAEAIDVIYATPEGMPRRFVWRRAVHDIARVEGPERIAPEWWRQPSGARLRDYYRVEDAAGRRYWIYRKGVIGDGRGGLPSWFIQGLFG